MDDGEKRKKLGNLLATHRKKMNLRELAKESGVSTSVISRIENGMISPTIESLVSLAKALKIKPKEFLEVLGYQESSLLDENSKQLKSTVDIDHSGDQASFNQRDVRDILLAALNVGAKSAQSSLAIALEDRDNYFSSSRPKDLKEAFNLSWSLGEFSRAIGDGISLCEGAPYDQTYKALFMQRLTWLMINRPSSMSEDMLRFGRKLVISDKDNYFLKSPLGAWEALRYFYFSNDSRGVINLAERLFDGKIENDHDLRNNDFVQLSLFEAITSEAIMQSKGIDEERVRELEELLRKGDLSAETLATIEALGGLAKLKSGKSLDTFLLNAVGRFPESMAIRNLYVINELWNWRADNVVSLRQWILKKSVGGGVMSAALMNNLALAYIMKEQPHEAFSLLGDTQTLPHQFFSKSLACLCLGESKDALNLAEMGKLNSHSPQLFGELLVGFALQEIGDFRRADEQLQVLDGAFFENEIPYLMLLIPSLASKNPKRAKRLFSTLEGAPEIIYVATKIFERQGYEFLIEHREFLVRRTSADGAKGRSQIDRMVAYSLLLLNREPKSAIEILKGLPAENMSVGDVFLLAKGALAEGEIGRAHEFRIQLRSLGDSEELIKELVIPKRHASRAKVQSGPSIDWQTAARMVSKFVGRNGPLPSVILKNYSSYGIALPLSIARYRHSDGANFVA